MAHNSALIRKVKSTRLEDPSMIQTYRQQVNETIPKVINNRRSQTSKQRVPESSKDINHKMGRISNPFDLAQSSKNAIRVAGGGGAAVTSKYQSRVSLNNQPSKTVRTSVTTASFQKLTTKEIKELKETREFKVIKEPKEIRGFKEPGEIRGFKEPKEIQCFKEPKELKELREHRERKEPRDPKELKELKEPKDSKDSKAKGADKSPNLSHRSTRHSTNRTKNYFDKYLKFAFDLSTPDGVQKLENHFFPNQNPNATGSSNLKQEE
ncbi:hypothetical protein KR084_001007 [Drosophila pseudotakahashii]|nr:hypothetical protein KR084_001007 [Drosophila pseudotakahashii]